MDVSRPDHAVASVPDLEDIYDEQVLARIDAATGRPVHAAAEDEPPVGAPTLPAAGDDTGGPVIPRYPVARRIGAAVMAGALLGVAEVLEPERARHHIIDFVPEAPDEDEQLVTFHLVPGDPRASRLVVRPWLLERFRRRQGVT